MECGEEDLDWKVAPIPGKGLGIVALRDIPPKYRSVIFISWLTVTDEWPYFPCPVHFGASIDTYSIDFLFIEMEQN